MQANVKLMLSKELKGESAKKKRTTTTPFMLGVEEKPGGVTHCHKHMRWDCARSRPRTEDCTSGVTDMPFHKFGGIKLCNDLPYTVIATLGTVQMGINDRLEDIAFRKLGATILRKSLAASPFKA